MTTRFVLASASPARLATLRAAGVDPDVIVSHVDEEALTAPSVAELVVVLAAAKADAVASTLAGPGLVLGCDSLLEVGGAALGKPATAAATTERWQALRGRSGVLHTGHCLIELAVPRTGEQRRQTALGSTTVHFADVSDDEIERYVATGEPLQVAGAFTVDGLGGWFVDGIEGDHHNVVGLSLPVLRRMLLHFGLGLADLGFPGPAAARV